MPLTPSERNADGTPVNDHRNAGGEATTNAGRQRRYRDRKRGGPPRGRWCGHKTAQQFAPAGWRRTKVFMGLWIIRHAPDLFDPRTGQIDCGEHRTVTALYKALRVERMRAAAMFFRETNGEKMVAQGCRLVEARHDHRFVFRWVKGANPPVDQPAA
jgi:hypothetical protein